MYDPKLGRFLQRDPLGYVDSMNLFSYVTNNPTNFVDSYGLLTIQIGVSATGGSGTGVSVSSGWIFGWSRKSGFQIGQYYTKSGGGFGGLSTSTTLDFAFSGNSSIYDVAGISIDVGGSSTIPALVPIAPGINGGGEVSIQLNGASPVTKGSIGLGVGTPEGHTFVSDTKVNSL